jgi:hypothetical protein
LSTKGSRSLSGGRFNIGDQIDPNVVPPFSAFYAACDKETALQEALGQNEPNGMSTMDRALAKPESVVTFSVKGNLEKVLDLTGPSAERSLSPFVALIRDFRVSGVLVKEAGRLPVVKPGVVKTVSQLMDSILNANWRHVPILCEIPANGQILGQLLLQAGVEGVLYPSKKTGKKCIAIFPTNLVNGPSFFELDDDPPPTLRGPKRVDASNFQACERTADELTNSPLRDWMPPRE